MTGSRIFARTNAARLNLAASRSASLGTSSARSPARALECRAVASPLPLRVLRIDCRDLRGLHARLPRFAVASAADGVEAGFAPQLAAAVLADVIDLVLVALRGVLLHRLV